MEETSFKGRKNARIEKDLRVRFTRQDKAGAARQESKVLDFSRSGLFIHTTAEIPIGTRLAVELFLEDEQEPLRMTATVCRTITDSHGELSGVGVDLTAFEADGKHRYAEFVGLQHYYGWFC